MSNNESSGKVGKKSRKQQQLDKNEQPELTKEENRIARHLRLNCPTRQGNLIGMKVDFFVASKLIDCLMDSKWGPAAKTSDKPSYFASRTACVNFMTRLMNRQMFYRALKVYKEQTAGGDAADATPNLRKRKAIKPSGDEDVSKTNTPSSTPSVKDKETKEPKKKFKLEMHEDQRFLDAAEPYVWVYDPTSTKSYIIGGLLILAAILICLFPLWPPQVRDGVYYVSLAGAGFLGVILSLAVFKYIIWAMVWVATFGAVSFWIFPNLTEDVGFFESFVPLYKCSCGRAVGNDSEKPAITSDTTTSQSTSEEPASTSSSSSLATNTTTTTTTVASVTVNPAPEVNDAPPTPVAEKRRGTFNELSQSTVEINHLPGKEDEGFELLDEEPIEDNEERDEDDDEEAPLE